MTFERALELILGNLGVLVLLLIIMVGGFRGWWVYGRFYDAQARQIERLEERLDRALGAAESGTGLARQAIRQAESRSSERAE